MKKEQNSDSSSSQINNQVIPQHVAIIMDGNGRWANQRGLSRSHGHKEGMSTVREIAKAASKHGVKVLSLYAFSTENWRRPIDEVRFLMQLPSEFFNKFMPEIQENNIKITVSGFPDRIPGPTRRVIDRAINQTENNNGMILNFALNYGGRAELVHAARQIAEKVKNNELDLSDISEERFEEELLTNQLKEYQDVDLLIRTSGEKRLSNFLLWQNAYSEFYFTSKLWPDFKEEDWEEAMLSYQQRKRRFGGVNSPKH